MFLCSLLDSHPELYVLPHSIHRIFPTNEERVPSLYEVFSRLKNDASYKEIYQKLYEDNSLKEIELIFHDLESSIKNYVIVILIYFYKDFDIKKKFVLHTHDIVKTKSFIKKFPNCELLLISRNPANIYASYIKKYRRSMINSNAMLPKIKILNEFSILNSSLELSLKKGLIILEELHANPKKTMNLLSQYLKIHFDKLLLQSTILGNAWIYEGWKGTVSGFNDKHKFIDYKTIGKTGEVLSFKCTATFQNYIGYSETNKMLLKEKLNSYLPGKVIFIWYLESIKFLIKFLIKNRINIENILLIIKYLIKHWIFYPFYKLYELFIFAPSLNKIDKKSNFNSIEVINKLSKSAFNKVR